MHRRNFGTESWRERGAAELGRLEEAALLDKRRRDLETATDPFCTKDHEGTRRTMRS